MTTSVRVLTTRTCDSSPSILLVAADGSKILVNCGEGCQRAFLEYQQRVATVRAICLTHIASDAIGGLPGMILTAADVHSGIQISKDLGVAVDNKAKEASVSASLDIIGPPGTRAFLHSLRHFVRRDAFRINISEDPCEAYSPSVAGTKAKKPSTSKDDGFLIDSWTFQARIDIGKGRKRPRDASYCPITSFMFTTGKQPGKFLPHKALELGVPKGPLFGKLKNGESVSFLKNEQEHTVHSHQVVEESIPGKAVFVLRLPENADDMESFVSSIDFVEKTRTRMVEIELIVFLCSTEMLAHPLCVSWRRSLPDKVQYIHLATHCDPKSDCTPFHSANMGNFARSLLSEDIFATPAENCAVDPWSPDDTLVRAIPMLEYIMSPGSRKGLKVNDLFLPKGDRRDGHKLATRTGAIKKAEEIIHGMAPSRPCDDADDPSSIFFTGTGSAIPCKHRNVSGICLTTANGNSMLLDVGEGTVGQLLRQRSDESYSILSKIRAVWISHPHADHHLGILRLLEERNSSEPLLIIAPTCIFHFLAEYEAIASHSLSSYVTFECTRLMYEHCDAKTMLHESLGIVDCRAVAVAHCRDAFAIILDGTPFGRLVYSGDCRPSKELAVAANPCDILIHEATFEDGLEADAVLKKHSTVGEALAVGSQMNAKWVVLTHFSQRYPRIPELDDIHKNRNDIIFAFDFMRLRPSTLQKAAALTPGLRLLYVESNEEKEATTAGTGIMDVPGAFALNDIL